jgi:hypothetical protein
VSRGEAFADFTEPVIGRAFARPVCSIRATCARHDLWCDLPVQPHIQKYFRFHPTQITGVSPPIPRPQEGRWPSSLALGAGCGGRGCVVARVMRADERRWRVRRSRVVLTPRRWRQVRERPTLLAGDGDKKARSPGRARNKPSNHCAGKAGLPPLNLYARVRFFDVQPAHETAGAARTRSSLRPLSFGAKAICKTRAPCAARMRRCVLKAVGAVKHLLNGP